MPSPAKTPFVAGPIVGAGSKGVIKAGALPNMQGTIRGWFQPMAIGVVTSIPQEDGTAEEKENTIDCQAVVTPANDQDLKIIPEGMRSWKTEVLYTDQAFNQPNGAHISFAGTSYTIMKKRDYSAYGYVRYVVLQGYHARTD